jgi:hypothetical protein
VSADLAVAGGPATGGVTVTRSGSAVPSPEVVVCSFYTGDEYYAAQGERLRRDLERLGLDHVVEEVRKDPGADWADTCRKKVPFLQRVCEQYPDRRVFWMDVDCRLLSLPRFVRDSQADILGFQRGFGSPLTIGYRRRSRFWEPCFWGVGTSPHARKMIRDAAALEAGSDIKATDDYFFEEAWRRNADALSFQVLPSGCVAGKGGGRTTREVFFVFGSSGSVAEFKDKVVQHTSRSPRAVAVRTGKRVIARLPAGVARTAVGLADRSGLTATLIPAGPGGRDRKSRALTRAILQAGLDGDSAVLEEAAGRLALLGVPDPAAEATLEAARAFAAYAGRSSAHAVRLCWWPRPFPGNFGDWLSPLVVGSLTGARVRFQSPVTPTTERHLVAIGSIGRFVRPSSVVVGTGVSSDDVGLHPAATYLSVRGPATAALLRDCGGPRVDSFGDPGAVLSRVLPLTRGATNGRVAFVRHLTHRPLPVELPDEADELSVAVSTPQAVRTFLETLLRYDVVVTSALHVLVACQSYGVPCALVTFEGFEDLVHGSGLKYADYAQGVGVAPVVPAPVPLDLRRVRLAELAGCDRVGEEKQDEILDALRRGLELVEPAGSALARC